MEFLELTFSRHDTCNLLCDTSLALARFSPTRRYTGLYRLGLTQPASQRSLATTALREVEGRAWSAREPRRQGGREGRGDERGRRVARAGGAAVQLEPRRREKNTTTDCPITHVKW